MTVAELSALPGDELKELVLSRPLPRHVAAIMDEACTKAIAPRERAEFHRLIDKKQGLAVAEAFEAANTRRPPLTIAQHHTVA